MILKLIQFIFLIVIVYVLVSFIRIIFSIGKSAGEINRKIDEINRNRQSGKKGSAGNGSDNSVIELDKNQYKVE